MLFESEVISAVCNYLKEYNFEILQQLDENQKGDDIIALTLMGQSHERHSFLSIIFPWGLFFIFLGDTFGDCS